MWIGVHKSGLWGKGENQGGWAVWSQLLTAVGAMARGRKLGDVLWAHHDTHPLRFYYGNSLSPPEPPPDFA